VLEVDDVRFGREQELPQVLDQRRLAAGRAVEPVVFEGVGVEEVLVGVVVDPGQQRALVVAAGDRDRRPGAGEEERFELVPVADGAVQLVGVGLGSPRTDRRVVMGDVEDLGLAGQVLPRLGGLGSIGIAAGKSKPL
jgi:hypothetical protein